MQGNKYEAQDNASASNGHKLIPKPTVIGRISDFLSIIKSHGPKTAVKRASANWFQPITELIFLSKIKNASKSQQLVIFLPLIDWNVPLFQRPHQLALHLSMQNKFVIFCTPNAYFDQIRGFNKINLNLILCSDYRLLDKVPGRKVIYSCSTDNNLEYVDLERELLRNNVVIYDYIDEIDEKISGTLISDKILIKHDKLLCDERLIAIASADKLYQDVAGRRTRNCALVTNGVDIMHFSVTRDPNKIPEALRPIRDKGAPVLGYFGALASWFDYELILYLSKSRPNYQIVLIGYVYDEYIRKYRLDQHNNILVLDPVHYSDLPDYGCWFDVSLIPFLLNSITESTSPIKLFEYMALGKPIVTTDMPECRKYKSVLIGHDHDEFIRQIDHALTLTSDERYRDILRQEAEQNTWDMKARAIWHLVEPCLQRSTGDDTIPNNTQEGCRDL